MKKYIADYAYLLGIAGIIIALDYWTKWLVRTNLTIGEQWSPWTWLAPYARIVYWHNTGAAFGIFQDMNTFFSILAVVVSIVILYYFPQVSRNEWYLRLAMSMQLGGAVGNLIDRIREGYVIDFVSVGTFAVFNVADASISIGVAVLLIGLLLKERNQRHPESADGLGHAALDADNYPDEEGPDETIQDAGVESDDPRLDRFKGQVE